MVLPTRVDELLGTFEESGYSSYRKWDSYLYKVARPNVTIDLMFKTQGGSQLDEEMLRRSGREELEGIGFRVPSPEDQALMKALGCIDEQAERSHAVEPSARPLCGLVWPPLRTR